MLIGVRKQHNGLYFFEGMEAVAEIRGISSSYVDVWHFHLGHTSSKALEILAISDFKNSGFDSKTCDLFICVKQIRNYFPKVIIRRHFIFN